MATFGDTTAGGSSFPYNSDRAIVRSFVLSDTAQLQSITIFFDGSSTSVENHKGLIYADSGGLPGALVAVSSAGALAIGGTSLTLSISGTISPGTYWLGGVSDGFTGRWAADAGISGQRQEGLTYASPANPFGTPAGSTGDGISVYVTYVSGPVVTTHPSAQRGITAGGTATFTVAATGTGTLSYQWKSNESGTYTNVGTNSTSYTTGTLTDGDSYDVYCEITDTVGTTSSQTASVWVTTKVNPAWMGLYSRGGRSFVSAQAKLPTSKAAGNIFDTALFDVAPSGGSPQTLSPSSIATAEAFGTAVLSVGTVTISPSGIASLEAFGTTVVTPGAITLSPGGIATAETFGSPTLTQFISLDPTGIASAEAFGTHTISVGIVNISPSGITSSEAFGTATVTPGGVTITVNQILSDEAFGTPAITTGVVTLLPGGIASGESFGTAVVDNGVLTITLSGIASGEAFGSATISAEATIQSPNSIPSAEAFGTPTVILGDIVITIISGIPSAELFGTPDVQGGSAVVVEVMYVRGMSAFGRRRNS